MVHIVSTLLLGPLLVYQGRRVRQQVPILPEPSGDRLGTTGSGPALSLLVTGDSAAAGVGAQSQQQALLGQIVEGLADRFTVRWKLHAATGATTASTIARLRDLAPTTFDVIVTSLGVNDVTAMVRRAKWLDQQKLLRQEMIELFRPKLILLSGFPPVHSFPALPQPLRWYLGRRSTEFDRLLAREVAQESQIRHLPLSFAHGEELMASDGFHPGPPAYALWGQHVAETILHELTGMPNSRLTVPDRQC